MRSGTITPPRSKKSFLEPPSNEYSRIYRHIWSASRPDPGPDIFLVKTYAKLLDIWQNGNFVKLRCLTEMELTERERSRKRSYNPNIDFDHRQTARRHDEKIGARQKQTQEEVNKLSYLPRLPTQSISRMPSTLAGQIHVISGPDIFLVKIPAIDHRRGSPTSYEL